MPGDSGEITARALSAYSSGDFYTASALYEELCQSDPDNIDAWTRYGACHLKLGNLKSAEASLRRALELEPDSISAMTYLASALAMSGRLRPAAEIYQEVTQRQPNNYLAWLQLAETLLRLMQPEPAVEACERARQLSPDNVRILMTLGKALHAQQNREQALECFRQVLVLEPEHGGAHYSLGWILHELGDQDGAIAAYRKTIEYAPNRVLTHFYLGGILQEMNRLEEAETAYRRTIEVRPDYLKAYKNLGYVLRKLQKPAEALPVYQQALTVAPGNAEIHLSLGHVLRELNRPEAAAKSYDSAIRIDPNEAEYPLALGRLYHATGEHEKALNCFQQVLRLNPDSTAAYNRQGQIMYTLGRHGEAAASFRQALQRDPDSVPGCIGLAAALMASGNHEEASGYCEMALRLRPADSETIALSAQIAVRKGDMERAYSLLHPLLEGDDLSDNLIMAFADVSRDTGRTHEAAALLEKAIEKQPDHASAVRVQLHFSLGKLYDREGDFDRAFQHYQRGNALKQTRFDPDHHMLEIDAFIAQHTWQFMTSLPRASIRSDRPVFVTGMPRSGTTLVEQILSSHPAVYGAGELSDIGDLAGSLPGIIGTLKPFPQCLPLISTAHLDQLATTYLGRLERLSPDALRVTDKMLGFMYLGLIELMLPAARIIHCVRDPMDTCLSAYFQDFTKNHPYSYDLRHLGVYYKGYRKIMRNWKNVLSNIAIMDVQYEELVADQEAVSRKIVEFCGLPWDDRCLRFHENDRFVGTASYDQVRRPMYKSSAGRWRKYENYLGALKDALGDER